MIPSGLLFTLMLLLVIIGIIIRRALVFRFSSAHPHPAGRGQPLAIEPLDTHCMPSLEMVVFIKYRYVTSNLLRLLANSRFPKL